MATAHIPASVAEVQDRLSGLDRLIKAREWERAAIIYAHTREREGQGTSRRTAGSALSFSSFADLGIAGLRSENTVARYNRAWAKLVKDGVAADIKPGDTVELPDLPWPQDAKLAELGDDARERAEKAASESGVGANKVADIMKNPNAAVAAVKADRKLAVKIAKEVLKDEQVRETLSEENAVILHAGDIVNRKAKRDTKGKRQKQSRVPDHDSVLGSLLKARSELESSVRVLRTLDIGDDGNLYRRSLEEQLVGIENAVGMMRAVVGSWDIDAAAASLLGGEG